MTLQQFQEKVDEVGDCRAIVVGKYLLDEVWSQLKASSRFVAGATRYPTWNDVDLIPDSHNPTRFEPIY